MNFKIKKDYWCGPKGSHFKCSCCSPIGKNKKKNKRYANRAQRRTNKMILFSNVVTL